MKQIFDFRIGSIIQYWITLFPSDFLNDIKMAILLANWKGCSSLLNKVNIGTAKKPLPLLGDFNINPTKYQQMKDAARSLKNNPDAILKILNESVHYLALSMTAFDYSLFQGVTKQQLLRFPINTRDVDDHLKTIRNDFNRVKRVTF